MEETVKWFALTDIPLSAKHRNAINAWLTKHKVSRLKKPRNHYVEGNGIYKRHLRQRRCVHFREDEAVQALIKDAKQKLVLEARPIVLEHLGVRA